ncbi:MAG: hypothetical protein GXY83_32065 [Rhodopirellula sp.]|nr:hypothetical protein [Rhodopirellula sp.]
MSTEYGAPSSKYLASKVWKRRDSEQGIAFHRGLKKHPGIEGIETLGTDVAAEEPGRLATARLARVYPAGQNAQNTCYASPVWIHVDRQVEHHVVRAIAFPAAFLPDLKRSDEFLKEFLA